MYIEAGLDTRFFGAENKVPIYAVRKLRFFNWARPITSLKGVHHGLLSNITMSKGSKDIGLPLPSCKLERNQTLTLEGFTPFASEALLVPG